MSERSSITCRFDGRERQDERGLWVECRTEEFCIEVLKFEIMNSRKLFNYFSRVVPKTIEFVPSGGLKMACLKIDRMALDL